jgi:Ca2+-binding EF-hand superfamily protein
MKTLVLAGAAAVATIAASAAYAQVPPPPGVAQGTAPIAAPAGRGPQMRVMTMSEKAMTRDEVVKHVREFFGRLDANHDGFITRDELGSMRERMMGMHAEMDKHLGEPGMMRPDRGAMFDKLDTNHDGSISRQEYMAAKPQVREERVFVVRHDGSPGAPGMPVPEGMKMRVQGGMGMGAGMGMGFGGHLFDMADANHDGRVSRQEAESAALAHFDRADTNHDGKLSPEEHGQLRKFILQRRRG